jgi:WD40 repeat protein
LGLRTTAVRHLIAATAAMLVLACTKDLRVEPVIGMEEGVRAVFDPADESRFLVVEKAGAIVVWTRTNGSNRRALTIRTDAVDAIFHKGAIASIHRDGSLRRWRLDGENAGSGRPEHASHPTAIAPLADRIITADDHGRIHEWTDAFALRTTRAHEGAVIDVATDPKRSTVVTVGADKKVREWRVSPDGSLTNRRSLVFDGEPLAVDVAEDGVLAIGGRAYRRGAVELIDLARDARVLRSIKLRDAVTSVSFSALTGALAANSNTSGAITINRDGTLRETHAGDSADIVAFSRRGDLLIALSPGDRSTVLHSMSGEFLFMRDLATHTRLPPRPPPGKGRPRGQNLVLPFADGFVAATEGGDLTFTDARGTTTRQVLLPDVTRFAALGVSEVKGFVVAATDDGKAWLCPGAGPAVLLDEPYVNTLAVSRSGLVVLQRSDATIAIREPGNPQVSRPPIEGASNALEMAFVNDSTLALVDGERLELVHLENGKTTRIGLNHPFHRIAVSPDGTSFALGASDGFIGLFDRTGALLTTWRPKDLERVSPVMSLAFSARERVLASTHTLDRFIRLWNVPNGSPRAQPLAPETNDSRAYSIESTAFARSTDFLLVLHDQGVASSYALGLTPVAGGELGEAFFGAAAVAHNGTHIATVQNGKAWSWDPDASSTPLPTADDNLHSVTDVVYAPDGTLFAATDWLGPVMAWKGKQWELGKSVLQTSLATTQSEAIYVANAGLHWWKPGENAIAGLSLDASDGPLAHIAAMDSVVLAWEPENDLGVLAVASRTALTWKQATPSVVIAVAAPGDKSAEPMFATASRDGRITLWRNTAADRWSDAWTVRANDGTQAQALAFGTNGRLLVGTRGGSVESRDLRTGGIVKSVALGNSVTRLGVTPRRIWGVLGNQQIVFLSGDLEIRATMTPRRDEAIVSTPAGWHSGKISRANFYQGASFDPLPEQKTTPLYSANDVTAALTGRFERWRRVSAFFSSAARSARDTMAAMSWKAWVAVLPSFALFATIVFLSTCLAFAPHVLAGWAMDRGFVTQQPPLGWIPKWMRWITWFGHRPRAVDAWLARFHGELLPICFTGREHVKKRSTYVDLGNESELEAWRNAMAKREEIGLWIVGPGGCGKSTLAFKLAHEVMESRQRPPLPIVVDTDWEGALRESVRQRLRVGEKRPTEEMLNGLARRGRIVLVIDGLSERRDSDKKVEEVIELWTSGMFRAVIVASRKGPPKEKGMREVRVGPLTLDLLPAFARAYVTENVESAVQQLTDLSEGQPIRPLFARLACERIVEGKPLPTTYPDLVHHCVVELRPPSRTALSEADFLRAARFCAAAVVETHLAATQVTVEYLRGSLRNEVFARAGEPGKVEPAECIEQLILCGLLEPVDALGTVQVRFAFDLIAEYLAAMELLLQPTIEVNKNLLERAMASENALHEALDRVVAAKLSS